MKICCDIDGVLADVRPFVQKYLLDKSDWKEYFSHTLEFAPIKSGFALIDTLLYDHKVELVSGRPESNRSLTRKWLSRYLETTQATQTVLHLRKDSDHRSTSDIKLEWFKKIRPSLVIDDDPAVVEVATREGFVVLQVHGYRITNTDMVPTNYK